MRISSLFAAVAVSLASVAAHAADVPAAVQVPAGNKVFMNTFAMGQITYECKEKADAKGQYAWTFKIPFAYLYDTDRNMIGRYYGSPKGATWEANDGSKVIGKQLAISPNPGAIPLQLVQNNGTEGSGAMNKVSFIQRLDTKGGTAPTSACDAGKAGKQELVTYSADYIMWTAQ